MIMYCHMGKLNVFFKRLRTFVSFVWGDTFLKILLWAMSEILLPMFSSRIFMASGLTFMSLIHFEFILVCGVRRWSSFIFPHVPVQLSQPHLLDKLYLAHCMCLLPLSNIIDNEDVGLFLGSLFCSVDLCFHFYASTRPFHYHGLTV